MQWLERGSRLLRAVQHHDGAHARGKRCQERLRRERSVEADDGNTDSLAEAAQLVHRLFHGTGSRSHQHDHSVGVGRTVVVDEVVLPARP